MDATPTNLYLGWSCVVGTFRLVMYFINFETVSSTKVTKQAWKDEGIREVMFAFSYVLGKYLFFRLCVSLWAMYLVESEMKNIFCAIMLVFDCVMLKQTIGGAEKKSSKKKVMVHQNKLPPLILQGSLVFVGFLAMFLQYGM